MTNHLIILENIEDWAPYFPSAQVIAVDDYLQTPSPSASERAQKLKYHIQTSGRSLHAQEIDFSKLGATLHSEIDKLQQIVQVSQQTRETLAKWTILGGGEQALSEAEARLRAFEEATRNLMEFV